MAKLLTLDEAAARLNTPANTLRYWRQTGIGPRAARIGRRLMYREEDLDAWIEAKFAAPDGASVA